MTTVSPKVISMKRDIFSHVERIMKLDSEDMHLIIANYVLGENLTSGLSKDKSDNLDEIKKFLKIHKKEKTPIETALSESTTIKEVKSKVEEEKNKKKENEELSEEEKAMVKKAKEAYMEMCKEKSFLASKAVDAKDGFGCLRDISKMKMKLETVHGAKVGAAPTSKNLKGFKENQPLGAGSIVLNDDLCLHHDDLDGDGGWVSYYRDYSEATKHGVLIMAGKPEYFQIWAKSQACLNEVSKIPNGRLFAYIEHRVDDGFDKDEGFIVHVDAQNYRGSATVEDGKGYMIFASGSYYRGDMKGGYKHGSGVMTWADADGGVYEGNWKEDKRNGHGIQTWASGDIYDGEWKKDKKHGNAIYTYPNGNKYNMVWENDKEISRTPI